ncbi:MAG: Holliday junction branch migration DNA helicase RuvB, partial [Prevotella sp.]|nr:Holliday junction branch migration DNA helicase RuvB [Prevotella sp.]
LPYLIIDMRDYAKVSNISSIISNALSVGSKILLTIIDKFRGGPVGVSTIATAIGEDTGTVEEVYEPFLIMEGFIKRTPRGRMVTPLAYEHLGRNPYKGNAVEPSLF